MLVACFGRVHLPDRTRFLQLRFLTGSKLLTSDEDNLGNFEICNHCIDLHGSVKRRSPSGESVELRAACKLVPCTIIQMIESIMCGIVDTSVNCRD